MDLKPPLSHLGVVIGNSVDDRHGIELPSFSLANPGGAEFACQCISCLRETDTGPGHPDRVALIAGFGSNKLLAIAS
jgi:hypothetical protein